MSKYKIYYHRGVSGVGHFYIEFEEEIVKGIELKSENKGKSPQRLFGKNSEFYSL